MHDRREVAFGGCGRWLQYKLFHSQSALTSFWKCWNLAFYEVDCSFFRVDVVIAIVNVEDYRSSHHVSSYDCGTATLRSCDQQCGRRRSPFALHHSPPRPLLVWTSSALLVYFIHAFSVTNEHLSCTQAQRQYENATTMKVTSDNMWCPTVTRMIYQSYSGASHECTPCKQEWLTYDTRKKIIIKISICWESYSILSLQKWQDRRAIARYWLP